MEHFSYIYYLGEDNYPGIDYNKYYRGLSWYAKLIKYIKRFYSITPHIKLIIVFLKEKILFKYNMFKQLFLFFEVITKGIVLDKLPSSCPNSLDEDDKQKLASDTIQSYMFNKCNKNDYGYIFANIIFPSVVRVMDVTNETNDKIISKMNHIMRETYDITFANAQDENRLLILENYFSSNTITILVDYDNNFVFLGIISDGDFYEFSLREKFQEKLHQTLNELIKFFGLYHVMVHNLCELIIASTYRNFTPGSTIYNLLIPFEANVFDIQNASRNVFYFNDNFYYALFGETNVAHVMQILKKRNLDLVNDPRLLTLPYEYPFFDDYKLYQTTYKQFIEHVLSERAVSLKNNCIRNWLFELESVCKLDLKNDALCSNLNPQEGDSLSLSQILCSMFLVQTFFHSVDAHTENALAHIVDFKNFDSLHGEGLLKYSMFAFFINGLYIPGFYNKLEQVNKFDILRPLHSGIKQIERTIEERNTKRKIKLYSTLPKNIYMGVPF
jgi:hypothetical protein